MFIMLNPSTADAYEDDATIRRCIGFAKAWNYGGIVVCNQFAYRATDPKQLLGQFDPVGRENMYYVNALSAHCPQIVCAWGKSPIPLKHNVTDFISLDKLFCIEFCKDGSTPRHPLYLPSDSTLKKYYR